jgi:hypothetical protein
LNRRFEPYGALLGRPNGASASGGATKTAGEWVIEVAVRKIQSQKSPNSKEADEEALEECITTFFEEMSVEARADCRKRYVDKKCPFARALLALETVPPFEMKCAGGGAVPVTQAERGDVNRLPSAQNESIGGLDFIQEWEEGKKKSFKPGGSRGVYTYRSCFDAGSDNEEDAEDERMDETLGRSSDEKVRIQAWELVDLLRSRPVHARDVAQSLGIEAARASIVQVRRMPQ